ncbi:MAG: hypothetical protein ABIP54_00310, partial [Candidatus Andersenbacteria bacterium]
NCKAVQATEVFDETLPAKVSVDSDRTSLPLLYARISDSQAEDYYLKIYSCTNEAFSNIIVKIGAIDTLGSWIIWAYSWFTGFVVMLFSWLLTWFGSMLTSMIGQGQFISSSLVQGAWPFVQGIANLGFIIALLYIAFATTLRLENASLQRLLPKLLIAALLVNFSLIIGGLLIDVSRIVMATEMNMMSGGKVTPDNVTAKLLERSNLVNVQLYSIRTSASSNAFGSIMMRMTQEMFFIILITVAFGIIAINMFVRYVALLILLIISPLAYLALALPQTANYAKTWWGMFIKWVAYGPIVLFFLLIIINIQNVDIALPQNATNQGDDWKPYFDSIVHFVMIVALFFVANYLGKKSAGIGSDVAMGFANKTGAWARKNPKKALIFGGAALGGGLGLAAVGAGAALAGGQYVDKKYGFQEARRINKIGKAKEEQDRVGKTAPVMAAKLRYGTQEYKNDMGNADAIKKASNNATDPALAASKLWGAEAGKAISERQIDSILATPLTVGTNDEQLRAVVSNPTIVAKMTPPQRSILNTTITNSINTGSNADKEVARQMLTAYNRSLTEVERKSSDANKIP